MQCIEGATQPVCPVLEKEGDLPHLQHEGGGVSLDTVTVGYTRKYTIWNSEKKKKELRLFHKLKFSNPNIYATQLCKSLII